jgi:hypothetical protein
MLTNSHSAGSAPYVNFTPDSGGHESGAAFFQQADGPLRRRTQVAPLQGISAAFQKRPVCRKVPSELYFLCLQSLAAREGRKT